MEILSNLIWLCAAALLWGLWLARVRPGCRSSQLSAIGVQLVALAMLTAILLPAISITDDLQAAHFQAEVERCIVRNERHLAADLAVGTFPPAFALLAFCLSSMLAGRKEFLLAEERSPRQGRGHQLAPWSRPPPAI